MTSDAGPISIAWPDAAIRRRLWIVLVIYEALVISIVAGAGLNIALMGGGSMAMAAPLLLISCAEALRIPLSAMAPRLRWGGQMLAAVALLAIAIGSAEGLVVAFEAFLENRVVDIMRANGAVERAQRAVDQITSERTLNDAAIASLAGEVSELDAQVAALAKSIPQPPAASNKTCTWKGQRVSCSADGAAIATYREAMKAYDARLTSLSSQRAALQAKVDAARGKQASAGSPEASDALLEAKQALEEKAGQSPVWRLTAAVFSESVSEVTPAQFARVKAFVTATLAIGFATLSMAVSIVVHAKLRSEAPSKLARALRAMIAARRKTLRRISDQTRVEWRDRPRFVYVPTDDQGRVINPNGARR
jgi:hypothetical protein